MENPNEFRVDIQVDQILPLYRKFASLPVDNTDTDDIYGSNSLHKPQIKSTSEELRILCPFSCGTLTNIQWTVLNSVKLSLIITILNSLTETETIESKYCGSYCCQFHTVFVFIIFSTEL